MSKASPKISRPMLRCMGGRPWLRILLRAGLVSAFCLLAAPAGAESAELEAVRELYENEQYAQAMRQWMQVSREAPDTEGLQELKEELLEAIKDEGVLTSLNEADISDKRMALEMLEQSAIPETYGMKDYLDPATSDHRTPAGPMRKVLDQPVSMHLKGADLAAIIQALSQDDAINLIADHGLGKGQKLDIELDDVPLREVLEYVERNFKVRFHTGENIIWVTAQNNPDAVPMETRIYPLNKGLQVYGSNWILPDPPKNQSHQIRQSLEALQSQPTILPSEDFYIEVLLRMFVPQPEGAGVRFDPTTHTLIVRNYPEHLELTEDLLDRLDVTPPQILIEARFIEVTVSDLLELGLDWILDSSAPLFKTPVQQDGRWVEANRSEIAEGSSVQYPGSQFEGLGSKEFPASPAPGFGALRDWSPSTADYGLNITFRGVLTQPEFRAVLHALEISGKGKSLSVPRVTTINNSPAKLRDGSDLLYYDEFEVRAFNLLDDFGRKYSVTGLMPKGKPQLAELGITLVAVPSIGDDLDTISLLLKPSISKLENFQFYTDQDSTNGLDQLEVKLPTISRRQIETKLTVKSGETVVMGGLIETAEQDTLHKVPVLGSIPLLGNLFRKTDKTQIRKNLLIFVTATVISERGESLVSRRELRERAPEREPE